MLVMLCDYQGAQEDLVLPVGDHNREDAFEILRKPMHIPGLVITTIYVGF